MKILVTGGRDYQEKTKVFAALDACHKRTPITMLIHGGARGADSLSWQWAKERGVPVTVFLADWSRGKKAGILRNVQMLKEKPDGVIAFPGGRGTRHMVTIAAKAAVTIWLPYGNGS